MYVGQRDDRVVNECVWCVCVWSGTRSVGSSRTLSRASRPPVGAEKWEGHDPWKVQQRTVGTPRPISYACQTGQGAGGRWEGTQATPDQTTRRLPQAPNSQAVCVCVCVRQPIIHPSMPAVSARAAILCVD